MVRWKDVGYMFTDSDFERVNDFNSAVKSIKSDLLAEMRRKNELIEAYNSIAKEYQKAYQQYLDEISKIKKQLPIDLEKTKNEISQLSNEIDYLNKVLESYLKQRDSLSKDIEKAKKILDEYQKNMITKQMALKQFFKRKMKNPKFLKNKNVQRRFSLISQSMIDKFKKEYQNKLNKVKEVQSKIEEIQKKLEQKYKEFDTKKKKYEEMVKKYNNAVNKYNELVQKNKKIQDLLSLLKSHESTMKEKENEIKQCDYWIEKDKNEISRYIDNLFDKLEIDDFYNNIPIEVDGKTYHNPWDAKAALFKKLTEGEVLGLKLSAPKYVPISRDDAPSRIRIYTFTIGDIQNQTNKLLNKFKSGHYNAEDIAKMNKILDKYYFLFNYDSYKNLKNFLENAKLNLERKWKDVNNAIRRASVIKTDKVRSPGISNLKKEIEKKYSFERIKSEIDSKPKITIPSITTQNKQFSTVGKKSISKPSFVPNSISQNRILDRINNALESSVAIGSISPIFAPVGLVIANALNNKNFRRLF